MAHRHVCPALISSVENQKDSRLLAIWSCYCCHFLHGPIRLLWMGLLLLLLSSCCWRLKPSPPLLLLQDDSLNNIILPHFHQHMPTTRIPASIKLLWLTFIHTFTCHIIPLANIKQDFSERFQGHINFCYFQPNFYLRKIRSKRRVDCRWLQYFSCIPSPENNHKRVAAAVTKEQEGILCVLRLLTSIFLFYEYSAVFWMYLHLQGKMCSTHNTKRRGDGGARGRGSRPSCKDGGSRSPIKNATFFAIARIPC